MTSQDGSQLLCIVVLIVLLLIWSNPIGSNCGPQKGTEGFANCDGDCQGPRVGACVADCSISCRSNYSARENFNTGCREKFSPDSTVYSAPGSLQAYTSACGRSAETPLARAAEFENAAIAAVNGGATL
jgi:hypothetical protein